VIGLRQHRGSGVTGIAVLAPSPVDSAMTLVSVFITGARLGDETGTIGPTAVPAPADQGVPSGDVPPVDQVPVATVPAPVVQDPVVVDPGDDDDDDGGVDDGDDDDGGDD
jgi:hypothetical protein